MHTNFSLHWPSAAQNSVYAVLSCLESSKHRNMWCATDVRCFDDSTQLKRVWMAFRAAEGQWNEILDSFGGRCIYCKNNWIFKFIRKIGNIKTWWSMWGILSWTKLPFSELCQVNKSIKTRGPTMWTPNLLSNLTHLSK